MMFQPFEYQLLAEKLPLKVESLLIKDDELMVGTNTGSLLIYKINGSEITLAQSLKNFSKKSIEQICSVNVADIIAILTDGYVQLYNAIDFSLFEKLSNTKGAIHIDSLTYTENEGEGDYRAGALAILLRKKVLTYRWIGKRPSIAQEFSISDKAKIVKWCEKSFLCLGFGKELSMLNTDNGQVNELLSSNSSVISSFISVARLQATVNTIITPLRRKEVLFTKENCSLILSYENESHKRSSFEWSGPPEEIIYFHPYIVALLPRSVEIVHVSDLDSIIFTDIPQTKKWTSSKVAVIASQDSIWLLKPISLTNQISKLIDSGDYQMAIKLLKMSEDFSINELEDMQSRVENFQAFNMLRMKNFTEAFTLLQNINTDPVDIISLFPELVIEKKRYKSRTSIYEKFAVDLIWESEEINENLFQELSRYLAFHRSSVRRNLANNIPLQFVPFPLSLTESNPKCLFKNNTELLTIIDTALLKAYFKTSGKLVGPLLRVDNNCDLDETEKLLRDHQRYNELVDFFYNKSQHKKALDLLISLEDFSEHANCERLIAYLSRLNDSELMLEFASKIFEKDEAVGIELFTTDHQGFSRIPHHEVINFLENTIQCIPGLRAFLEYVVNKLKDNSPEIHNKLIILYLDVISHSKNPDEISEARKKLQILLEFSSSYSPNSILAHFPKDSLYDERIILFGKIGLHKKALDIYINVLKDFSSAESYCFKKTYAKEAEGLFEVLLGLYLEPLNTDTFNDTSHPLAQEVIARVLHVLNTYGAYIQGPEVLKELGHYNFRLCEISSFFKSYFQQLSVCKTSNKMLTRLLEGNKLLVHRKLSLLQSKRILLTEERMCPVCLKRIGSSVFVYHPNGILLHYVCKDKYMLHG